ncbi:MAG: hypothetical protein M3Y32_06620 [Pseudomonadota bacterium]|nr:hypothetical protein [Pseudomonadota bacterium]
MTDTFGMAQIVDAVIAFTLIEVAALAMHHRMTGAGVALRDIGLNLVSGLCLMLALRCGVRDAGAPWIALWLLAAGLAHAADLSRRWRPAARPRTVSPRRSS